MSIFVLAAVAALQAAVPSPAASMSAAGSGDAKKVCHSDTPTGSHFAKRTCHTAAEWKIVDAKNEQAGRALSASRSGMQMEPFAKQRY